MKKQAHIVRYSTEEIEQMVQRDGDQTDWEYLGNLTEEELDASIDHEEEGVFDWTQPIVGLPPTKRQLTIRLDLEVIDWFKRQGPRYQTRMNEVLKWYVEAQRGREHRHTK